MKFLFWLLALATAAVAIALTAKNPGYVLLVYPPYRIELSLTFFVLGLAGLLVFIYYAMRIIMAVLRLPNYVRSYREQRALNVGRAAMMEALKAFFEGRYAAAEKAAVRAMESGDESGINPIIAARSAHELGETGKRDRYLAGTEGKSVGESTMRLIAQTEFMLDQKQPHRALDSLKEISTSGMHKHIGALQLELKAQQQARNWDGVLNVVAQLEKRSAIGPVVALQMRQQAWMEKLRAETRDLKTLQTIWKAVPDEFRLRPKLAAIAATNFIKLKDCKSAQQLLTSSLNAQWDSELVALYGECQGSNNVGQIEQAEKWLNVHSDDAGLLLALGKLCMHHGLWGKAQSYLDASNSLAPSHAAYTALAQLAEKLHKTAEAAKYTQRAMELK
ncbi:MAG: heme biosynthesis protein HemY [Gallionellales bacterium 35-53-114]|jgi:HemY protein|nr:MAG: heme biosynthesis protein HemY [Gallionellales bacterium 35-53-114]OYZ63984.1 MAG: heme biosynthesis protein HemY [Gallionellales bacterium 24-53-125]OZB09187.1 MAG: heme biosynthesis protein HemY [Gallionellales bacterium 39-52-133]HQS59217.1 heme biosynthesis HemY N-terminal domain-containing protein [Gallionellaceae bacterium]HQS75953.1 heme biosynthesis HemY N-terminal domain-containing protein [Gallionellaceae bacterium]